MSEKQEPVAWTEWVGLTDMERQTIINTHEGVVWETAIAIEQTLKEKNAWQKLQTTN